MTAPGLRQDVDTVSHLLALGLDRLGGATRSWSGSPASTASRPNRFAAEY
ncbi:hypothetical protein ABGB16_12390 [Micromonospora sp. B11E3]